MKQKMKAITAGLLMAALSVILCDLTPAENTAITFVLDWTPNTNHTGIYTAIEKGYFDEAGLDVTVVQPPDDGAEVLVASGQAQFGVSFQDTMADALSGDTPLPITAVAAVVQHNTSGIVSRKGEGMDRPSVDAAVLTIDLRTAAKPSSGTRLLAAPVGSCLQADTLAAGATSTGALSVGDVLTFLLFKDADPVFDYYTPVIIASDSFLSEQPETAKAFVAAAQKGYTYAAENPEEAADILMAYVPELKDSEDLIYASQAYLSKAYIDDAESWGVIDPDRWSAFYEWLNENQLVEGNLDPEAGFSNAYLP